MAAQFAGSIYFPTLHFDGGIYQSWCSIARKHNIKTKRSTRSQNTPKSKCRVWGKENELEEFNSVQAGEFNFSEQVITIIYIFCYQIEIKCPAARVSGDGLPRCTSSE